MKNKNKLISFDQFKLNEAENPLDKEYLDDLDRRISTITHTGNPGSVMDERIMGIEADNRDKLETLAYETIMDVFGNVLPGVNMKMKIIDLNSSEFRDMVSRVVETADESEERKEEIAHVDVSDDPEETSFEFDQDDKLDVNDPNLTYEQLEELLASDVTPEEMGILLDRLENGNYKEEGGNEEEGVDVDELVAQQNKPENIKSEVDKRKLINIIMQGSSFELSSLIHTEICKTGLAEISPDLFDYYENFISVVKETYLNSSIQVAGADQAVGANEVEFENEEEKGDESASDMMEDCEDGECNLEDHEEEMDLSRGEPTINALGYNFIVLLHEAVKGIYELISHNAIPENPETAMEVLSKTDTLEDEAHDLKYGQFIRKDLVAFILANPKSNEIDNVIEYVFSKMVAYPADHFVRFFMGALKNDPQSRSVMDNMIDEVYNEQEEDKEAMRKFDAEQALSGSEEHSHGDSQDAPELSDSSVDDILGTPSSATEHEPETEQENDYSTMAQSDLKVLMDDALDNQDYKKAKEIGVFLESRKYNRKLKRLK